MRRWAFDGDGGRGGFLGVEQETKGDRAEVVAYDLDLSTRWRSQLPVPSDEEAAAAHLVKEAPDGVMRAKATTAEVAAYHPRIYRPVFSPDPLITYDVDCLQSVQAARNIFARLREVLRVVEPDCADAYGHGIREVLLLACMEVESSLRAVLRANDFPDPAPKRFSMHHYRELAHPMRLSDWWVGLSYFPNVAPIAPFGAWDARRGGWEKARLNWYEAHHAVEARARDQLPRSEAESRGGCVRGGLRDAVRAIRPRPLAHRRDEGTSSRPRRRMVRRGFLLG